MKKKLAYIIISLILASITVWLAAVNLIKAGNPDGYSYIYYTLRPIERNTLITDDNINELFAVKKTGNHLKSDNSIFDCNKLVNMYVTVSLCRNEQITTDHLAGMQEKMDRLENPVETSVKFADIGDVDGGVLNEGDVVDIIITYTKGVNQSSRTITSTLLKDIRISRVFSQDGSRINDMDIHSPPALIINMLMSAKDAYVLDNAQATGRIKLIKKLDDSDYQDVLIDTSKQ